MSYIMYTYMFIIIFNHCLWYIDKIWWLGEEVLKYIYCIGQIREWWLGGRFWEVLGGGVQNRYFYPTCIHVMIHTLFSLRYSESFSIERRRRSRRFADYRPRIYVVITIMCAFFLPHSHDFQMEYLNVVCVQRTITTLYKNMTFIRNYFWFSTFVFAFVFFWFSSNKLIK